MEILVHSGKLDRDAVIPVIRDAWDLPEHGTVPTTLLGPMAGKLGLDDYFIGAYSSSDNELLGFVLATSSLKKKDQATLYMLAVRSKFQSSGLGFELMDVLKEELLKKGKNRVVFTFDPFNTRCANLYVRKLQTRGMVFTKEPQSVPVPSCKEDFPHRYMKVQWHLDELNPDKESSYASALKYLPVVRSINKDCDEFLIEISPSFQEKMRIFSRIANGEFKRMSTLFEHYINENNYRVVDFLYSKKEKKAFYKLKKM